MHWVLSLPFGLLAAVAGIGLILHPPLLSLCAGFLIGKERPAQFWFYLKISLVMTGCVLLALAVLAGAGLAWEKALAFDELHYYGQLTESNIDDLTEVKKYEFTSSHEGDRSYLHNHGNRRSYHYHGYRQDRYVLISNIVRGIGGFLLLAIVLLPCIYLHKRLERYEKADVLPFLIHYFGLLALIYWGLAPIWPF